MLRLIVVCLALFWGNCASAYLPMQTGVQSDRPLFDPKEGTVLLRKGVMGVSLFHGRAHTLPLFRATNLSDTPRVQMFYMDRVDQEYFASRKPNIVAENSGKEFIEQLNPGGLPFHSDKFSLHLVDGTPGQFIVQISPRHENGIYHYKRIRIWKFKQRPGLIFFRYDDNIIANYVADKSIPGITINRKTGQIKAEHREGLLELFRLYEDKVSLFDRENAIEIDDDDIF